MAISGKTNRLQPLIKQFSWEARRNPYRITVQKPQTENVTLFMVHMFRYRLRAIGILGKNENNGRGIAISNVQISLQMPVLPFSVSE